MTETDAKLLQEKIARFRKLADRRAQLQNTLNSIFADDPNGPCEKGPFTGNTRESRQLKSMRIYFTATKGGAEETSRELFNLEGFGAYEFGQLLHTQVKIQINMIDEEITKL